MASIISVNPFRCRMWPLHDRLESVINEETCNAEIQSVLKFGQLVPVLGRQLRGDADHDFELIYGARRLFVAQHLNKPLKLEVRELTDMEAVVAMDIENRHRKNISPYEHGLCYARWLRTRFFSSQEDIARALRISASQISRLLKLARLPAVIVAAFASPADICENWGIHLIEAWDTPSRRNALADRARALAARGGTLPAREIYRQLITSSLPGRSRVRRQRDEVVTDGSRGLFRIRHHRKWISLMLPVEEVSNATLIQIRDNVAGVLRAASTQTVDPVTGHQTGPQS